MDGKSPFEEMEYVSEHSMHEEWTTWKETNELVSLAVAQLCSMDSRPDTDIEEIICLVSETLQRNPRERSLEGVLKYLQNRCPRELERELMDSMKYMPLLPFDPTKVSASRVCNQGLQDLIACLERSVSIGGCDGF